MNLQRVGVMVLRYIFIYRRSPVRLGGQRFLKRGRRLCVEQVLS